MVAAFSSRLISSGSRYAFIVSYLSQSALVRAIFGTVRVLANMTTAALGLLPGGNYYLKGKAVCLMQTHFGVGTDAVF